MDKQYKNQEFKSISIKTSAVKRFRKFSRSMGLSQTAALELMLDFFKHNEISPTEEMGPKFQTLDASIKSRINAVIAIIKHIEKHQTKPTVAMLELLLLAEPEEKKVKFVEKKRFEENEQMENGNLDE
ncbi:BfmA/BtgA family mobilization protein [Formosa sp. L2A11]|uniref:BfmA/BtgA family mobilization protein n=1 Tax=Formosa sp. L2A11 TaxID=2686363 RepID=UPI00131DF957|nr:BfmA/BtgA family mobilization protein [Formosa sp. L2A11]